MSVALGFDYGESKIGLAIGNRLTGSARALSSVRNAHDENTWQALQQQIGQWQPEQFIVGIPLTMEGGRQPMTRKARRFAQELRERYKLPVHEVDERLSSIAAESELREARASGQKNRRNQRGDTDSLAAALLVQQWLDNDA